MSDEEHKRPRRGENLMQRRLRKSRGEEVPDELEIYDAYDEDEDEGPLRFGGGYQGRARPAARYEPTGAGCSQAFLYGSLALLIAVLAGALLFNQALGNFFQGVPRLPDVATIIITPTPRVITGAAVVQRIQQLSRLETASYTIQTVIEVNQSQGNPIFDYFAGDALLLIAKGTVVAGVDLGTVSPDAVAVSPDGRTVTLRLPPAEIFAADLDSEGTRVYSRNRGWFAPANKDLETTARQQAEQQILRAACEDGILLKASTQAEESMRRLLGLVDDLEVVVIPASPGPCPPPSSPAATTTP